MSDEETTDTEHVSLTRAPRSGAIARRDFGGSSLAMSTASTDALVAKARADVEARWVMAMRAPRNLDDVRQYVIAECKNPEFAKAAIYAKPVGGGNVVEGLSIRFAEMACRQMGNMSVEHMTIFDADDMRIARVTVTDFETNATWSKDLNIRKTVERKQLKRNQKPLGERVNSYGDRVYIVEASDDDVAIKEAALVSKASRTGILRLVPGNVQREAMALCKKVIADKAAKDPDGERREILDGFALIRVMPSDLEAFLGHPTTQILPVEIQRLRSIFVSIRDGETTWQDVLEEVLEARAQAKAANPTPGTPAATIASTARGEQVPPPAAAPSSTPTHAGASAPSVGPATQSEVKPAGKRSGSAALKSALAPTNPAPAAVDQKSSVQEAIDKARAREAERKAEPTAQTELPVADKGPCAGCGAMVVDAPGEFCGDCTAAARDAE